MQMLGLIKCLAKLGFWKYKGKEKALKTNSHLLQISAQEGTAWASFCLSAPAERFCLKIKQRTLPNTFWSPNRVV